MKKEVLEEKKVDVVVIRNNLKYRLRDFEQGRSFIPKIGERLSLPESIAKKELESNNVRLPLQEEVFEKKKKLNKKKVKK